MAKRSRLEGTFKINGREHAISFPPESTLLDLLRGDGHMEVKEGCREGQCGSCLVLLDGRPVNSCQVLAASVQGRQITTVLGVGDLHHPHPIQESFTETGAVQCGFCTPGMVLAAYALLRDNPHPSEEQIRSALDGNLCRCTGYVKIVEAIQLAAERMASHA